MKVRIFLAALLLLVSPLISLTGFSQGTATLHVFAMPGFPDLPADTVYEQNSYTFTIDVANNTNSMVQGLDIKVRVDNMIDTLISSPATTMQSNDTTSIIVAGYNFTQPLFKVGNNIVVVWPVVNGATLPVDSFITIVHFVPLTSLNNPESEAPGIRLHPVPAHSILKLETQDNKMVEYVRIFDVKGRLVVEENYPANSKLDVSGLPSGLYILEAIIEGYPVRRKFIRE